MIHPTLYSVKKKDQLVTTSVTLITNNMLESNRRTIDMLNKPQRILIQIIFHKLTIQWECESDWQHNGYRLVVYILKY